MKSNGMSVMPRIMARKLYYSTSSSTFIHSQENFQVDNTENVEFKPGPNVMLAYDSITIVKKSLEKMNINSSSSKMLVEEIASSDDIASTFLICSIY